MHPDRIASIMSGNPNFSVGSSHFTTASCIVFVGNIPYGLAENQLTDIFNSVGRVVCFRMVFDRETGRSKGYGFAEYIDAETAASAVRNLDSFEIMGRKLRVDYSSQGYVGKEGYPGRTTAADASSSASTSNPTSAGPKDQSSNNGSNNGNSNGSNGIYSEYTDVRSTYTPDGGYTADTTPVHTPTAGRFPIPTFTGSDATTASSLSAFLASLPTGTDAHPNLSTVDSISKTLSAVPPPQLLTALVQMKDLIASDPIKATETLRYCPQLTHALFQAMVMMNLVKPEVVSQLLETGLSGALPLYGNQMGGGFQQGLLQQQQQYMQQIRQTTPQQQQQQQAGFYGYASQQQQPALGLGLGGHGEFAAGQQQQEFMSQQQQKQMQQQIQVVQQIQAAQQIQQIQAAQAALQGVQPMQGVQGAQDGGAEDKVLLLQRVKLLSQEEISRLPAEQAQQVLLLKHKLMTEGMGGQAGF